jgi:hypothetical protein
MKYLQYFVAILQNPNIYKIFQYHFLKKIIKKPNPHLNFTPSILNF